MWHMPETLALWEAEAGGLQFLAGDSPVLPAGPASGRPVVAASPPGPPVYLDLAYLPGGGVGPLDTEFFLRVRALCYVISGQDQRREQGLRAVLDALLDAKRQWDRDLQVHGRAGTRGTDSAYPDTSLWAWEKETRGSWLLLVAKSSQGGTGTVQLLRSCEPTARA